MISVQDFLMTSLWEGFLFWMAFLFALEPIGLGKAWIESLWLKGMKP